MIETESLTIENIMRSEDGRTFMYECLQQAGTYGTVFNKDPLQHAYNAGAREHGLWLETKLKQACPDYYLMMIKENLDV